MSNFFPEDVLDAADKIGNDFIKGAEFEGEGLVLQLTKPLEKIKSSNPKYGAVETDWLVKNEILDEGETFRFTFNTPEGQERKLDSKSAPFFLGFKQCDELGVGDWVRVTRTGKTDKTRYTVEKIEAPAVVQKPVSQAKNTGSVKDLPEYNEEVLESPF